MLMDLKDEWIKLDWRKQEEGINSLPAFKAKFKKIRRFGILHSFHSPFLEEDVRNSHHSQSRLAR
ncbi:hypothetical protein CNBG_4974 [Cryptococcus deuterogattii R265]|uniref:uncharacterized protein n=1 Tax=Cryptococcus deuterogattii (strain R265) TaxID=294750 RepID=UPI0019354A29|nr:hypothetical protein CNBG_4974 [Cryptococcus deuterogattii R265]